MDDALEAHVLSGSSVPPVAGLLEGAHAGVGLGHEFLRHCQRTRALVHVLDGTSPDPLYDYRAIRAELALFNPALASKPQVCLRSLPASSAQYRRLVELSTPDRQALCFT